MSAVIYDPKNVYVIKRYATLSGAKGALTRALKTRKLRYMGSHGYVYYPKNELENLEVNTVEYFNENVDGWTTTTNMMSGKEVKIRKSDKGGCTDVGTERYWSM